MVDRGTLPKSFPLLRAWQDFAEKQKAFSSKARFFEVAFLFFGFMREAISNRLRNQ